MFKEGQLSDVNDSYYLSKHCENIDFREIGYIKGFYFLNSIDSCNSLNFISSKKDIISRYTYLVLNRNCKANNISRPDYINTLTELCESYCSTLNIIDMVDNTFNNDHYDMVKLLFKNEKFLNLWINSFVRRYNIRKYSISVAILEINTLIVKNIMTPQQIYKMIVSIRRENLNIKLQLMTYLNDNFDNVVI
jgi:hypothetical protein